MIQLMNKRLLIKENGAIGLANITMTHLTIAHFSKGKKIYLPAILLLKMSEIKGTRRTCTEFKKN